MSRSARRLRTRRRRHVLVTGGVAAVALGVGGLAPLTRRLTLASH